MNRKPIDVLIYGAGAVGATFGWRIAQNAHVRVTTVCRSNYDAVFQEGFRMQTSMWGNGLFNPHRVVSNVKDVCDVPFDYVICANKIVQSRDCSFVEGIRPAIRPQTTIVATQNGVCVEPLLSQTFIGNTILSAVCYVSCVQKEHGNVHQVAAIRPSAFHIGWYSPINLDSPFALQRLVELDGHFKAVENITSERWTKLIFNGSWNPVAAIYGMTTDEVYRNTQVLQHVQDLADEIYTVALAIGNDLPSTTPDETTNCARNQPPITLSMLQDARAGRPMEVEALCGSVLRQAEQLGIATPVLRSTYMALSKMNDRIIMKGVGICHDNEQQWSLNRAM